MVRTPLKTMEVVPDESCHTSRGKVQVDVSQLGNTFVELF